MGFRLSLMSVAGAVCLSTMAMAQPGPLPSADFAKQGMDRYNVGDFAGAIAPLERAVELEPNNIQYRLTLAESYRQTGQCPKARPLYKAIVDAAPTDAQVKATAESGITACPEAAITPPPPTPTPPAPEPEPTIVYRDGGVSNANISMLALGGVSVGLGLGLLFAAHGDARDADVAAAYKDHSRIDSRSTTLYVAGGLAVGVGVALSVVSLIRIKATDEHATSVSVSPRAGGGTVVFGGSW